MIKALTSLFFIAALFKAEAQSSVLTVSDSLMANGNFSKAIKLLENSAIENTNYRLAKAYNAIGNYDKAIANFKKAIANNTANPLLQYQYGKLLSKVKMNTEAVSIFKRLIATDSTNANYNYELGIVLERLNQKEAAQNSFKIAYKIDSTHQKAIYKLAKHSLINKQYNRLDTLITVGLQSYPNNAALISLKAQSLFLLSEYKNAKTWFKRLLELGEKSPFIYEKLSRCYEKEINYEKAITYLEQALLLEPKNAENLYRLGSLYQLINDYKTAEKHIKKALEIQDVPLDAQYIKLASIYNRLEQPQKAIAHFKKALKENPENQSVPFFLAVSKAKYYKDYQSKIDVFTAFIKNNPKNVYIKLAEYELTKLKKERFLKVEAQKN